MKKLYRGPYIDAFCQVWFHLAQLFQSRLKYEKVKGLTPSDDNTSHGPFGSGELKMTTQFSTIYTSFQEYSAY
jgi:hypothetical protein